MPAISMTVLLVSALLWIGVHHMMLFFPRLGFSRRLQVYGSGAALLMASPAVAPRLPFAPPDYELLSRGIGSWIVIGTGFLLLPLIGSVTASRLSRLWSPFFLSLAGSAGMMDAQSIVDGAACFTLAVLPIPLLRDAGRRTDEEEPAVAQRELVLSSRLASLFVLGGCSLLVHSGNAIGWAELRRSVELTASEQIPVEMGLGFLLLITGLAIPLGTIPFDFSQYRLAHVSAVPLTLVRSLCLLAAGIGLLSLLFPLLPEAAGTRHWELPDAGVRIQRGMTCVSVPLAIMAVTAMTTGTLLAYRQRDLANMILGLGIAQGGVLLAGLAMQAATPQERIPIIEGGYAATLQLVALLICQVGVGVYLRLLEREPLPWEHDTDWLGRRRTHPTFSALLLLFLASFIGLPGTLGFWAKLTLLFSALNPGLGSSNARPMVAPIKPGLVLGLFLLATMAIQTKQLLRWWRTLHEPVPEGECPEESTRDAASASLIVATFVTAGLLILLGLWPDPVLARILYFLHPNS